MEAKNRPFGVTVLTVLAVIAAILAIIHFLQALGIFPYVIGPFMVRAFSFWNALMWLLMIWVWVWLVQMLWNMDPQAWLFLAVITVFNLIFDFMLLLGSQTMSDVGLNALINMIILAYIMLPSVRKSFGQS